jgi:hypothetical protein
MKRAAEFAPGALVRRLHSFIPVLFHLSCWQRASLARNIVSAQFYFFWLVETNGILGRGYILFTEVASLTVASQAIVIRETA